MMRISLLNPSLRGVLRLAAIACLWLAAAATHALDAFEATLPNGMRVIV